MSEFDDLLPEEERSGPKRVPGPNDEVILAASEGRVLTEAEEQAIRDRLGYAPTEKRTRAERNAAAARVTGKLATGFEGALPSDIEGVWGGGRLDSNGALAENTARFLIGEWGLERFRGSAVHKAAVQDHVHSGAKADSRSDFRNRSLPKGKR